MKRDSLRPTFWVAIACWAAVFASGLLSVATAGAAAADEPRQRPLKIDDLFELEGLGRYYGGPFSFSPDGGSLAFTRVRSQKTLANHKLEYLWGNAGADVWLQSAPGQVPVNLTHGAEDGAGWWSPQWSPDGKWIAMLSTRTRDNVTLWVWEKASGKLRQLTTRGVDLAEVRERPVVWVDARHILCPVLPPGVKPVSMGIELQTPEIATAAWPKVVKGEEVTASVLNSGVAPDLDSRPPGRLLLIDVVDGSSREVAARSTRGWRLSPNGKYAAYVRQTSVFTPKANEALPLGVFETYTVEVAALDGTAIQPAGAMPVDVMSDSLRWSNDGNELAFLAFVASRDKPPHLYRLNVKARKLTDVPLGELDANPVVRLLPQLEWTASGDLLLLAVRREGTAAPPVTARRDWWLISAGGRQRNVSASMHVPPPELWPVSGRAAFFGMAEGEVWRVRPSAGSIENLTARFEPSVTQIAWPILTNGGLDEYPHADATYSKSVLGVRRDNGTDYFLLDFASRHIASLPKPAPAAVLSAFEPRGTTAIYVANDRNGLFAWRGGVAANGTTEELFAANTFLRDISSGTFKSIDYTSLDGVPLKGWLLLPPGYEPGKRYPLLTRVYAGSVAGSDPPSTQSISNNSPLNMQIPAAAGYVVLLPSMPLAPEGAVDDPMLALPNGVLPAVDEVIELGIADPERLFLMGQSFGGFSTYGLVTQTRRFKAAAALAGLSDLISLYGQFDARRRYTAQPHEELFQAALMESAQVRMGNPPWKDLGRYLRNSPIFFVDRVETPLLIVQGDIDYVALQQGEEFFTSLYRQGKRAQFVRYWGEGHVLESPANIRDMWERIFAWFDTFSPGGSGQARPQ